MATSRFDLCALALAALSLASMSRDRAADAPGFGTVAALERQAIEHVFPKRDYVGKAPARLEWTAVEGVDGYDIEVANDIDVVVLEYTGAPATSIAWPKEIRLEPGTYFWRVVGVKDGRRVADSGRAAFVVMD